MSHAPYQEIQWWHQDMSSSLSHSKDHVLIPFNQISSLKYILSISIGLSTSHMFSYLIFTGAPERQATLFPFIDQEIKLIEIKSQPVKGIDEIYIQFRWSPSPCSHLTSLNQTVFLRLLNLLPLVAIDCLVLIHSVLKNPIFPSWCPSCELQNTEK